MNKILSRRILTFIADNWLWLTFPVLFVGYFLSFLDVFFDWSPVESFHLGYWLLASVALFWVFAPGWFKSYKTKIV